MRLFCGFVLAFMGLIYRARGTLTAGDILSAVVLATVFWLPIRLLRWLGKALRAGFAGTAIGASRVMMDWPTGDPFTETDMARSVLNLGATGSGKTSGPGLAISRALAKLPGSGALILASKPEDREFYRRRMEEAGRSKDFLVFSETSGLRCGFIEFEAINGGDDRTLTQLLLTMQEVIAEGGKDDKNPFWRSFNERIIFNAIVAVRLAHKKVDAPALARFIVTAAYSNDMLSKPEWKAGFHNQTLKLASINAKTPVEKHDFEQSRDFWCAEFASMDDRTRSNGLAGVNNILYVFNTGIVRELVSTTTNISPRDLEGRWIFVDFPPDSYGASGKLLLAGWKFIAQKYILRRRVNENSPLICITSDEAQAVMNTPDVAFLNKCRGFKGCLHYLTQGIDNIHTAMGDEHKAQALMGQFGTVIANAVDPVSAEWLSRKVGNRMQIKTGGAPTRDQDAFDLLFGGGGWEGNFNEDMRAIMEPREFMTNLRTGGDMNQRWVDSYVIRAEAFKTGLNVIRWATRQEER